MKHIKTDSLTRSVRGHYIVWTCPKHGEVSNHVICFGEYWHCCKCISELLRGCGIYSEAIENLCTTENKPES